MNRIIEKESLGELVAEQLRKSIWDRKIEFGERLIESDLSNEYDVSRNTIRDALKILEYQKLIINKARKGTYVAKLSQKDWQELIELRTIVETFAFVKALPFLDELHFEQLKTILNLINETTSNKNWSDLFDLDMQFHRYVINLSRNSRIIKLYDSIQVQIRTFLLHLDTYYSSPQAFYDEHHELFNALLTKDPKIVNEKVRKHIVYVEGKFIGEALKMN